MATKNLRLLNKTAFEYEDELNEQVYMRIEPFGPHCPEELREEIRAGETADFLYDNPIPKSYEAYHLSQKQSDALSDYLKNKGQEELSQLHITFILKQKKQLPKELGEFLERNKEIYCY